MSRKQTVNVDQSQTCPNTDCNYPLRPPYVQSNYSTDTGILNVRVLCPMCKRAYEGDFRNTGGGWMGDMRELTDPRRLKGMKRRVEALSGQLEAVSA